MKRLLALVLSLAMLFSLAACTGGKEGDADDAVSPASDIEIPSDLPEYKVGVILYDLSNQWAKNIMNAIETVGKDLNITFEYAVGGTDPEETIAAIQNFGSAGYDGILTLHPGSIMATCIEICEEYGMYIVSSNDPANGSSDYAEFSANQYFAGEVWENDYTTAYEIVSDMIEKGASTFALHGFPAGLAVQMDTRLEGARAAIADGNAEIVTEGLSFNKAEAAENIISQFPDVDAIFSSVETVSTVYQPVVNAGRSDILLNCYDPADDIIDAMDDGTVDYAVEGTSADSAIALVLLYNAMSGNKMTNSDGTAASIEMSYIIMTSADEYKQFSEYCITGAPYSAPELANYITAINENASLADLTTFAQAFSLADVVARHG